MIMIIIHNRNNNKNLNKKFIIKLLEKVKKWNMKNKN